jgi:integrase
MARKGMHLLTDAACKALECAEDRAFVRLCDGGGLYLWAFPSGSRIWRRNYTRPDGRPNMYRIGPYPEITLKRAREKNFELSRLLAEEIDPMAKRHEDRTRLRQTAGEFGTKWMIAHKGRQPVKGTGAKGTAKSGDWTRWNDWLMPEFGRTPLSEVKLTKLIEFGERMDEMGKFEQRRKSVALLRRILKDAARKGLVDPAVTVPLDRDTFATWKVKSYAAITRPAEFGMLLAKQRRYHGNPITREAMEFSALTFQRPRNVRMAEWTEFEGLDGPEPTWKISGEKMKNGLEHWICLSRQAVAILKRMQVLSADSPYVFHTPRSTTRPLSENAVRLALRAIGYGESEHTSHGYRSSASSLLHEKGWDSAVIELALAHTDRNKIRATYNRSDRLKERRKLMQFWADYCDQLREAAEGQMKPAASMTSTIAATA